MNPTILGLEAQGFLVRFTLLHPWNRGKEGPRMISADYADILFQGLHNWNRASRGLGFRVLGRHNWGTLGNMVLMLQAT